MPLEDTLPDFLELPFEDEELGFRVVELPVRGLLLGRAFGLGAVVRGLVLTFGFVELP